MRKGIGKLRHPVTIRTVSTGSQDVFGEPTLSTSDAVELVWASIEPLQGREREVAQQQDADMSHKITIRYDDNITARSRIVHESRTFEVVSVLNLEERGAEMILLCKEDV